MTSRDAFDRYWIEVYKAAKECNAAQRAYEEDCARSPRYHDGTKRRPWSALGYAERDTWRRNPTPRKYK